MATDKGVGGSFARNRAKTEAPAEQDDYLKTTIFLRGGNWRALRQLGVAENVSASSLVAALVEQFIALDPTEQRATIEAARRIRGK